jgi:predicted Fe-Mo cluster-binding NifX family protein
VRIAVPAADGGFCEHFGGAKEFMIFEGHGEGGGFARSEGLAAPEHKPGSLPAWLERQGVTAVVASAIGERALLMLADAGIRVFLGQPGVAPALLAAACRAGTLPPVNRQNTRCNGEHHHHDHAGHSCHH